MLGGRAAAEVRPGHQHLRPGRARAVQHETGVLAPGSEKPGGEAGALDSLQPRRRDDLVGVDVAAVERDRAARYALYPWHHRSPGSEKGPATAAASAPAGGPTAGGPPRTLWPPP